MSTLKSEPSPPKCTYYGRRSLSLLCRRCLCLLFAAGSLLGCATVRAVETSSDLFEHFEFATGEAVHQTVLVGNFLGDATAELAVVSVGDAEAFLLRLYGLADSAWVLLKEADLSPATHFVDLATIGGRDRLLTYEGHQLQWLDPEAEMVRDLVAVETSYRPGNETRIPHVDVTHDVNRDGRDDIVVPDVDGFWVSTQDRDGSYATPVKLGPREPFADEVIGKLDMDDGVIDRRRTYGDVGITPQTLPIYLSRLHQMDYDQDGRSDLVFWSEDHFQVYRQNEQGTFETEAQTFTVPMAFDADGAYSRALDYRDQGVAAMIFGFGKWTEHTVLRAVADIDGDDVGDLVMLTLSGRTITKQRSHYEVYYGEKTTDGTTFSPQPATAIRTRGKAGGMQPWGYAKQRFEDVDGDGDLDLLCQDTVVSPVGMLRALAGNSVAIDLELYLNNDGLYPTEPTVARKVRRFAPFAGLGNVFFPPVLVGDVDGDGRSDLVVGHSPKQLRVYLGTTEPGFFSHRAHKFRVELPSDERNTRLVDLNSDGKQDLLLQLGPTGRKPHEPRRIVTLMAR